MGMFDYIKCEYPVPGDPKEDVSELDFQTKDLACMMENFLITREGQLVQTTTGFIDRTPCHEPVEYTGDVRIYWSNWSGTGPGGSYTPDGKPLHRLEYRFRFLDGRVTETEEIENSYEPALAIDKSPPIFTRLTPEEKAEWKARKSESLLGRTICVWWGGQNAEGYFAKVVAENEREIVVQKEEDHRFEIIDRSHRDSCFFDSYEDGKQYKEQRKRKWKQDEAEYHRLLAEQEAAKCPQI